jgi:putative oxidoreductase
LNSLALPWLAAALAVVIEFFFGIAVILGVWTRPLALVLFAWTLATALIGHQFWTLEGTARSANAINFYKNIGLMGGFLLLYITGPGRYSLHARMHGKPRL